MNRPALAQRLRDSIVAAVEAFRRDRPGERPYAFALIGGQSRNFVSFAIATEEGLRETAAEYVARGYRYDAHEWERADHAERLTVWLRWANPDDGWRYGDFADSAALCDSVRRLFEGGELTDDDGVFEAFCTDEVLSPLARDPRWTSDRPDRPMIVGFTYGGDPDDFLRSATRANPYPRVIELWGERWRAEELEARIKKPS